MPLEDYRDAEIEANGHFPTQSTHHLPKRYSDKMAHILEQGELDFWPGYEPRNDLPSNTLS